MIKESRSIKDERRINYAKAQAAEYTTLLREPSVRAWPDFAKEILRKKERVLREEVRRLENRQVFLKKLHDEQKAARKAA